MNEMFNEMVLKMILFTEEDSLSVRVVQFSVGVSLTYVEQENIQKKGRMMLLSSTRMKISTLSR